MQCYISDADFQIPEPTVVTLGKFDGRHRGHQKLLGRMLELKRQLGYKTAVFTFDTTPAARIEGKPQKVITTNQERRNNMAKMGIDYLVEYPFTEAAAHLPPETFVREILAGRMQAKAIVVGTDCGFGYRRAGNADLLRQLFHNAAQIVFVHAVKVHVFPADHGKNAPFVQKRDALQQGSAQNLALQIRLPVKAVVDDVAEGDPLCHEAAGRFHGPGRGIAVLEHAGVVYDAGVQALRRGFADAFLLKLIKQNFAGGTGRRLDDVFPGIAFIGHMMVHADAFRRLVQTGDKRPQPFPVAAVHADAQIRSISFPLTADFFKSAQIGEFLISRLQIHGGLLLRILILYVIVNRQTGTDAVPIRVDVAEHRDGAGPLYHFLQFRHRNPPVFFTPGFRRLLPSSDPG